MPCKCKRYAQDMPKICPRYTRDKPKIFQDVRKKKSENKLRKSWKGVGNNLDLPTYSLSTRV